MNVSKLQRAGYNPRNITNRRLKALAASMEEFGDLSGIVYNHRTDRLISGHQRIKTAPGDANIHKEPFTDNVGTVPLAILK